MSLALMIELFLLVLPTFVCMAVFAVCFKEALKSSSLVRYSIFMVIAMAFGYATYIFFTLTLQDVPLIISKHGIS